MSRRPVAGRYPKLPYRRPRKDVDVEKPRAKKAERNQNGYGRTFRLLQVLLTHGCGNEYPLEDHLHDPQDDGLIINHENQFAFYFQRHHQSSKPPGVWRNAYPCGSHVYCGE
jgi:hypothetical protein